MVMSGWPVSVVCLIIACGCALPMKPHGAVPADLAEPTLGVFYVAPNGNDAWSGAIPAPNRTKTDGPFATLARARNAVRALKRKQGGALKQPATVFLRGGTYFLSEPFVLTPEDSGTAACPVTYAAYKNEAPSLSGGQVLRG